MTDSPPGAMILDSIGLNAVQKEAVGYDGGPQLVFAGAGTGKTRVLTSKIAYLILHKGYLPQQIFAATFTNKAAREMKERVENLIGRSCNGLWIGTFHSLCARILRREASLLGYSPAYTIYDTDDQRTLMRAVLKELEIDERTMAPASALNAVSRYKNACVSPGTLTGKPENFYERELIRVYKAYQKALKLRDAMDFDDLIANTVYLFGNNPDILARYQQRFRHILIDEYQDTNLGQFYLVRHLAQRHGAVFAVGDDDQSIYGWRGACVENIRSFEKAFAGTRVFMLEQNYRSTRAILDFANAVIAPNVSRAGKKLWTSAGNTCGEVVVTRFNDDRREASETGKQIRHLVDQGVSPAGIMVLFRTNAQSRLFEDVFRSLKIPYVLVGGLSFYQRKEIKDCIAYLRLLVNPRDDVAFERIMNVPSRGLGNRAHETLCAAARGGNRSLLQTLLEPGAFPAGGRSGKGFEELAGIFSELTEMVASDSSPDDILRATLRKSGYVTALENEDSDEARGRIENIGELINAFAYWTEDNPGKRLAALLEEVALVSDVDALKNESGSVMLLTMHSAKGLEASHVFVSGLEDGIIPSRQNFDDDAKIEEERRLFYVAVTRAKETLNCSWVTQRYRFGSVMLMEHSRFLDPIPVELFRACDRSNLFETPSRPSRHAQRARPAAHEQKSYGHDEFSQETVQFRMGQHIRHKSYGIGRILSINGFGVDMRMTILFNDGNRRKLMAQFAELEII